MSTPMNTLSRKFIHRIHSVPMKPLTIYTRSKGMRKEVSRKTDNFSIKEVMNGFIVDKITDVTLEDGDGGQWADIDREQFTFENIEQVLSFIHSMYVFVIEESPRMREEVPGDESGIERTTE